MSTVKSSDTQQGQFTAVADAARVAAGTKRSSLDSFHHVYIFTVIIYSVVTPTLISALLKGLVSRQEEDIDTGTAVAAAAF